MFILQNYILIILIRASWYIFHWVSGRDTPSILWNFRLKNRGVHELMFQPSESLIGSDMQKYILIYIYIKMQQHIIGFPLWFSISFCFVDSFETMTVPYQIFLMSSDSMWLQHPRFDVLESLGFSLRQELVNDDLKRDLIEKARGVVKDWRRTLRLGKDIIEYGPRMSPTHCHPCPISAAFTNNITLDWTVQLQRFI